MTHSSGTIRQSATVVRVDTTEIEVEVCRPEACAVCKAKNACSEGSSAAKRMTLVNDGQGYQIGDQIQLIMRRSAGLKAVVIAYLIPVVLVVAALLIFQATTLSETTAALFTLGVLVIYFIVIRLLRGRIHHQLTIEIEKEIEL